LSLDLTSDEQAMLSGAKGEGVAMAMRIVADTARLMGAESLIPVQSAHIDGALYHGDSGTLFAERLVELGAKVSIRATLNVGGLDLMGCSKVNLPAHEREMAGRMMRAYIKLGCEPTWTCAPYQAGHRPALGSDVAWGESNAVVFCNSVLGARTNRYGDFLDIACAISGRAPRYGLHLSENRYARFATDLLTLPAELVNAETFWPIFGSLYGRLAGGSIGVVTGVAQHPGEDALKAFGAASASTGGVGLFHIMGVTPEAPDLETVTGGQPLSETIIITEAMFADQRRRMATVHGVSRIDAVAIGSPHLSAAELTELDRLIGARKLALPFYACTGRHALTEIEKSNTRSSLEAAGVTLVADTCVVVTPILKDMAGGVLMTNSGKFAQYAPGNTGYGVVFGSMAECVESAITGRPEFSGAAHV
jgi:predicted aconitase